MTTHMPVAFVRLSNAGRRLRTIGVLLCAGFGLLFMIVTFLPVIPWTARILGGEFHNPSGDVLVVLAHSVDILPTGLVLDRGSYWLSEYAQTAYRQGNFRQIIVTGRTNVGTPVAAVIADLLQFNGVPPDAIEIDTGSSNLREQAEAVQSLVRYRGGKIVLLASDYQMFRAVRVFAKVGVRVTPLPLQDAALRSQALHRRWPVFIELLRESAHIADHWRRGWL